MKWFKHDSTANIDAKLRKVVMKYGAAGYGVYWYCIELIAGSVGPDNINFELEHDAEIIAHDLNMHHEVVQELMSYMVRLELFENKGGTITCMKLAKRLDASMTGNPEMRKIINKLKNSHDSVMIESGLVIADKTRLEENREEEDKGFTPPLKDDVAEYFVSNSYTKEAGEKAWEYYEAHNWKDSRGNKVKSWKQKMRGVWFKSENKAPDHERGAI